MTTNTTNKFKFNMFLRTKQTGLQIIPTTGWLYAKKNKLVDDDETIRFIFN